MRAIWLGALLIVGACAERGAENPGNPGDTDGAGNSAGSGATETGDSGAGATHAGGGASGGSGNGGAGDAMSSPGGSAGATGGPNAGGTGGVDGGPGTTSCDPRLITCRRAPPVCTEGHVPSVDGSCYGPCVRIDACLCDEAEDCPSPEMYTCHLFRGACGPYVR